MNWNLEYLFKTKEEFKSSFLEVKRKISLLQNYKGMLNDECKFVEYFLLKLEIEKTFERVYEYASLKSDLNKKDVKALEDLNLCKLEISNISKNTSFEGPELLKLGKEKILFFLNNNEVLKQYIFEIEDLFRMNKYVLSEKEESILANYQMLSRKGGELYSSLSISDNVNKDITLENGETVKITQGNWRSLIMSSSSENERKMIFEALYESYYNNKNTYGEIYASILESDYARCKSRGFKSALESYLTPNNINVKVYENLVKVAGTQNESLKKYLKLRKKYLNIDNYYTYDRFLELRKSEKKYTYNEAKEIFFESIKTFPEEFKIKAKEALEEGFVDVYEKEGKRSGAYSSSGMNLRPYILLNFDETLDSVFTLAHEAGHSIHSLFAMSQPEMLQNYKIFVAEIASTFNEHNLLDHLMKSDNLNKDDKISLLQKAIDEIYSTFYRQTLFAEYELICHTMIEEGKVVNYEVLCNVMKELYLKYYDMDISKEKYKEYVWAYIPHLFYTPFYVYQYATSFAASFKIYEDIKNGKKDAFTRYINLLKAGGSKYPVDEAKDAGVDFETEDAFFAVVNRMDYLVNKLEELLNE